MNPVESTLIEKDGLKLWVDPVALAALEAARQAGGRTDHGALPSFDELPLRLLALEMRVERLEYTPERGKRRPTGSGARPAVAAGDDG